MDILSHRFYTRLCKVMMKTVVI